jgi:threonine aldolase
MVFPPTTLVAIENTHNRGGGVVFPQQDVVAICTAARALANARAIAQLIAETEAEIDMATVQTNIVLFRLPSHLPDADTVVRRAKEQAF